jgi:hypothetical protein
MAFLAARLRVAVVTSLLLVSRDDNRVEVVSHSSFQSWRRLDFVHQQPPRARAQELGNLVEIDDGLGRGSFLARHLVIAPKNGAYFDKWRQ